MLSDQAVLFLCCPEPGLAKSVRFCVKMTVVRGGTAAQRQEVVLLEVPTRSAWQMCAADVSV